MISEKLSTHFFNFDDWIFSKPKTGLKKMLLAVIWVPIWTQIILKRWKDVTIRSFSHHWKNKPKFQKFLPHTFQLRKYHIDLGTSFWKCFDWDLRLIFYRQITLLILKLPKTFWLWKFVVKHFQPANFLRLENCKRLG